MKYALITGATSGIGKEFAIALARKGYNLILTGRREKELNELKNILEKEQKINIILVIGEFSDYRTLNSILENAKGKNIKFLINNVGYGNKMSFFEGTLDESLKMINVHINSVIRLCYEIAPLMKDSYIINTSSMAAYLPTSYNHIYASTKSFLITFSEALNFSLKNNNVKVKVLCPGFTYTDFHRNEKDIKSKKNKFKWMKSEKVVEYTMKNIDNKKIILVPGIINKIAYYFLKLMPKFIVYNFLGKEKEL